MDRRRRQSIKPVLRAEGDAHLTPFRYQTKWEMDYGMEADTAWFTFGLVDYGLRYEMEPWRNSAERSEGNERRASGGVGNPKHGRFINRDPIGEAGGLNLYEAFGGDPVNRWDFLGLSPLHDGRIRVNHDERTITLSLDVYFRSSVTQPQQQMFRRGADEVFGGRNIGGYTTSILINPYPRSRGPGRTIAVGFDLRRGVYGESLEGFHIDFNMRLCEPLNPAEWADIVGHEILHQYGIPHYDTENPDTDWKNLMYEDRDPRASPPREILLEQLLVEGSRYVVIEGQNNGSSSRNPFSRFWSWLTGRPNYLAGAQEIDGLLYRGIHRGEDGLDYLVRVIERMETANEALARVQSGPRGYSATNMGRFEAQAAHHLWRAMNPYFASLESHVRFGTMSSQSMAAMMEAHRIRQEWEANNER